MATIFKRAGENGKATLYIRFSEPSDMDARKATKAKVKREDETIIANKILVSITGGRLDFGPWEQIFYGEFDGRRKKRALVKIIGE